MMKSGFWNTDWFLGLAVAFAFVLLALFGGDVTQSLERKAYDLGVHLANRVPADNVAIIAIDDVSIANIGRFPWPREIHAQMIDLLAQAKARVIGLTIFFAEPQVDPGLQYIDKLSEMYKGLAPEAQKSVEGFAPILAEAEDVLNADRKLAVSVTNAGTVVLPMLFQLGEPLGNPDQPLPAYILKNQLSKVGAATTGVEVLPLGTRGVLIPLEEIAGNAAGIGHLNSPVDVDGSTRFEPLVLRYYEHYFPSMSMMLAAKSLNLGPGDIEVKLGESVRVGKRIVRTDPELNMYTYFYKDRDGKPAFSVDSFFDVISGKIPAEKYRDKIVLIGATAAGVGAYQVTPVSPTAPPVLTLAHAVSSILSEHFFVVPEWGYWAEKAVFILVALYLILLLPRLKAGMGAAITGGIFAFLLATHFVLMSTQLLWLQLMTSVSLLIVGHLALTTKRFLATERGKLKSDADSAESNRMLGLAFQGQGQLDMAFDKFRRCPLDDSIMENLYNLALDFERKRQFNKAQAVYEYMASHNAKFRDVAQKTLRAKHMSETVMLGGNSARTNASNLLLDQGNVEKPMLGRYQVEKELGKGAMGVVYLGKDPKIGRVVAIKTMALSQEFEADELEEVKQRFFREAETAGRLNHPNIVTIYDAGEEHDLAYIAMEFLKGKDLVPFTKPGNLLPMAKMLVIVARVADALFFAHQQNVVHRDVKPANIMYDADADAVKVTDFGIARITDSSRTKTGMVLGTPSYMSPEQLAGNKIDGQSDIFSLGVTLYQLASGHLPFVGESMTQLMYKIANDAPPDILSFNPTLPECMTDIINKALAKNVAIRYKSGDQMAQDLRACVAALTSDMDLAL